MPTSSSRPRRSAIPQRSSPAPPSGTAPARSCWPRGRNRARARRAHGSSVSQRLAALGAVPRARRHPGDDARDVPRGQPAAAGGRVIETAGGVRIGRARRGPVDPPRPSPYLAAARGRPGGARGRRRDRPVLVAVAASALVCALVRAVVERTRIERPASAPTVDRVAHRPAAAPMPCCSPASSELTGPRLRADLARVVSAHRRRRAEPGRALTPSQHNRRALAPHVAELRRLADRLADPAERR